MSLNINTKKFQASLVGTAAPLIWSFYAVVVLFLTNLPRFEVLAGAFGCCFITFMIFNRKSFMNPRLIPKGLWIAGILGMCVNPVLYITAFRLAPATHVDLINYLWPILTLFGSTIFLKEKVMQKHVISGVTAFSGIVILMLCEECEAISSSNFIGYLAALGSALTWTTFSLTLKHYNISIRNIIPYFSLIGFIVSLILHLKLETFVMPSTTSIYAIIFAGTIAQGISYFCWDKGIRNGSITYLSLVSYLIPVLSISFLIIFGYAEATLGLLVATIAITLSGFISTSKYFAKPIMDADNLKQPYSKLSNA